MNTPIRFRLVVGAASLVLVAAVTYACKDWLNTPTQGTLDATTLETKDGVEGSLIAAYRAMDCVTGLGHNWGCAASNWVWAGVASDDSYKGSNAGDQGPITDIETYNWSTGDAETYLDEKWAGMYEGISRANATLNLLAKVQAEHPGEISAADALGIAGEAIFLRAHFHFELLRMFGHVPYLRETDTDYKKTNVGVNDTTEILADLDDAISKLSGFLTPRNGDVGRATMWTALAYKGRVLVYARQYPAAEIILDSVVNKGPYALETSMDHVWTGLHQYANGKETILAFEASVNDHDPNGDNGNWGERLNFPYIDPFCCGFNQPTQNLVNFFAVDDSGLPKAVTDPNWNVNNLNVAAAPTDTVDPRLDFTAGRDGVPYKDWGVHKPAFIRDRAYSGPYSPKKNVQEKNAAGATSTVGWLPAQLNSVHLHIYRYADLLLLLAEAEVEDGKLAQATAIVNQIRARAGQTAQGCGSADAATVYPVYCTGNTNLTVSLVPAGGAVLDTLTTPWAFYKIGRYSTFPDQASGRTAVQYERRLELALEGQRFFDLRRWGTAQTVMNAYTLAEGAAVPPDTTKDYARPRPYLAPGVVTQLGARHNLYPIPQTEIDLSRVAGQATLTQNTGW